MKSRLLIWTTVFGAILLLVPSLVLAQNITGTKIIGGTGTPDYPTLTAAITALNTNHASGTVTFLINGDLTEPGSPEITDTALVGTNKLIIKPNTGMTPTVTFTAVATSGNKSNAGLTITGNSASFGSVGNVTIDGSKSANGTTQDMTFAINDATNGRYLIRLSGHTDNVTIKNLKLVPTAIRVASASGNRTYGINCLAMASGAASDLTITNCAIMGSTTSAFYYGIYKPDGGTVPAGTGLTISGSTIFAQHKGMSIWWPAGATDINNNTISILGALAGSYVQNSINAIYVQTWTGTCNIYNNKLITLKANVLAQTTLKPLYGILLYNTSVDAPAGQTANVYNNFISDFSYTGDAASYPSEINGIAVDAYGQTTNLYFNTIYINNTNITSNPVYGIRVYDDSLQTANLKNNIIVNTVNYDSAYAIYRGAMATNAAMNSDYNDLYVAGANANIGNYGGTKCKTLANWQTTSGKDANSKNVNPANPFGAARQLVSVTDLHWFSAPTNVFAGSPIAGYTKDIDGDTRSTTAPYMGADEAGIFTGVAQDPSVPRSFSLEQNYPNPFNPTTAIRFSVPQTGWVSLKVSDVLGQHVATLFEGVKSPGLYTMTWDAARVPSGVYFYRLSANGTTETRRMQLIK